MSKLINLSCNNDWFRKKEKWRLTLDPVRSERQAVLVQGACGPWRLDGFDGMLGVRSGLEIGGGFPWKVIHFTYSEERAQGTNPCQRFSLTGHLGLFEAGALGRGISARSFQKLTQTSQAPERAPGEGCPYGMGTFDRK